MPNADIEPHKYAISWLLRVITTAYRIGILRCYQWFKDPVFWLFIGVASGVAICLLKLAGTALGPR